MALVEAWEWRLGLDDDDDDDDGRRLTLGTMRGHIAVGAVGDRGRPYCYHYQAVVLCEY